MRVMTTEGEQRAWSTPFTGLINKLQAHYLAGDRDCGEERVKILVQ